MEEEEIKKIAKKIMEAKRALEEVGQTRFEGVNANVKKAMISIEQALYDLGEEEGEV
jgi:predicted hydrocarbon binding protein